LLLKVVWARNEGVDAITKRQTHERSDGNQHHCSAARTNERKEGRKENPYDMPCNPSDRSHVRLLLTCELIFSFSRHSFPPCHSSQKDRNMCHRI
jgi:hypothetical protein